MNFGSATFKGDVNTQSLQLGGSNKLKQERNRAYLFIGLLLLVVGGMASAITVLASIHTVIPVVSVMDANGHVLKQQVVDRETITAQESFVQSQVYDFIMDCNTFDPAWRQRFADLCRLHATPDVARQYDAETAAENPQNPTTWSGRGADVTPKITGITSLGKDAYQVSFQSITEKAAPSRRPSTTPRWCATPSRSNRSRWAIAGKTRWASPRRRIARIRN
ncbi:type VI secretion protein (plasmid) [Pandoraea faecigallinarum]|uniref:Type VI secretion protein n=1 Tax=Pandoraea faecigallinarum TaxID=656179 RepID=A0A1D6X6W0_9BURK|nr:type VI secretion protein [Pandoraea faecigallinarum]